MVNESQYSKPKPNPGLFYSLGLHAFLLLFLITEKSLMPDTKPLEIQTTLRVDLVGLPDLMKAELPTSLPAPVKEIAPSEPEKKETAPPPEVEKDDLVIPSKKTKPVLEKEKAKPADRKKQISDAFKRIKSIEKLKDQEEKAEKDAAVATVIKGNKISPGSSLSGEAKEALEVGYYEKVKDALSDNWSLPPWLAKQELSAQVVIQLDPTGHLQSLRFLKSSGNAQFDSLVKTTVRESLPLPKPPKNLIDQISGRGIVLGFPL